MDEFEQLKTDNVKVASDITQLAGTEDSRLAVITAVYIRLNNEMRLQSIQDIKKDISYGAKEFRQPPEKYVTSMDSIVRSYIQETNRFMKAYNDEFKNIQNILKLAEERQKFYFFKIRETMLMKKICVLAGKDLNDYAELDNYIKAYRRKLGTYEKIIARCDKEFEDCKNRREQDFKELFEIKQELALTVIKKENIFNRIAKRFQTMFKGYEKFSKYVLQKHAAKINRMKTETISAYNSKIKQQMSSFSDEIEALLGNA